MATYVKIPKPTTSYTDLAKPTTRIYPYWGFIDENWGTVEETWSALLADSFTEIAKPANALLGGLPFFSGGLQTFLASLPFSLLGSYRPNTEYTEINKPVNDIFPYWGFVDENWSEINDTWSAHQMPSWTKIAKPS